jgi:hypothetical protein
MRDFITSLFSDSEEDEELKTKGPRRPPPKPLDDNYWYDPWRHVRTDLSIPATVETPGNAIYYKENSLSNASMKPQMTSPMSLPVINAENVQNAPKIIETSKASIGGGFKKMKTVAVDALKRGIQSKLGNDLR